MDVYISRLRQDGEWGDGNVVSAACKLASFMVGAFWSTLILAADLLLLIRVKLDLFQTMKWKPQFEDIVPAVELYSQFLPDGGLIPVQTEYMRWQQYWQRQPATVKRPDSVVEALRVAAVLGTYPSISILLRIFAILPVTTATGERSFSALKYIKNYLRSTMGEERLNGLAHMYINRDISLNYEKVIDEFGKFNRRLSFV